MLGQRMWGKRLGIIGMGRIGQAVARRAKAFGLQIHYHNRRKAVAPSVEEELEATYWESLDQMLARMDIVSVNCPHTPATYHLLSARRLKLMKPDAYIVNTARGEVIDENALARMLEAANSPAPASTCSSTSRRSIPSCSSCHKVVLLAAHGRRPPSKAASTWARRSSSTSRPSWTATTRPTACCRAPGLRDYHPHYFAAFLIDPDGNRLEAVCHRAES
jgi:hypothetical protein